MADAADRHDEHDPLLIAALLDADPTGFDRAAAASRVASCPGCAALYADLVALSTATRELPTQPRPRDFTLTSADAARLIAERGEPGTASPRLTGVMTDTHAASSHASHDTILIASLADHSLPSSEREAAEALVAACSSCAVLHADLLALRAATRAMPTPARPRDYTLTHADAARLRPGGWRRWVAAFGTSRDVFSRPLAVGLTTLGLAGLLVATVPSVLQGGVGLGGSSSAQRNTDGAPATGSNPEISTDTSQPSPAGAVAAAPSEQPAPGFGAAASPAAIRPASSGNAQGFQGDGLTASPGSVDITSGSTKGVGGGPAPTADDGGTAGSERVLAQDPTGVPTLILLSGALLLAGLALFAIRWTARRVGGD